MSQQESKGEEKEAFSMPSLKQRYFNEHLLERQPVSTACGSGRVANLHPPATAGGTDPALHSTYLGVPIIVIPDFSQTIVTKSQPERVEKKNFFLVMCRFHEFGKIHLFLLTKRFYD
jgi:hypothetical protein